ncbi:gas vesicle protein GvpO [Actinophytocola sp.]|uniref:gas vesicle protein GvpO n=1 Tax=Actinophytocola sp. TaxID=1872138 RepID=UPI002ED421C5
MKDSSFEPPTPPDRPPAKLTAAGAIRAAVSEFRTLTGREPEGVTGVRKTAEGGWSVLVDVVELERIPATTSVLGTYRVDIDRDGDMVACERLRRYTRGTTDM